VCHSGWGPCDRTLTIGENDDNGTLLETLADDDATALAFALEQPGVVIYFVAAGPQQEWCPFIRLGGGPIAWSG
jgi:hypothetical protein